MVESDLLEGAIDLHIHSGPSLFPRLMDAHETALVAKKAGMRGVVIKHHHVPTVERGYFVSKSVPEVDVIGGVTLNYAVGGLNPFAVDAAMKLGGRIIWMPSADALNHVHHFGELGKYGSRLDYERPRIYGGKEGITVLDEDRKLLPNVHGILDVIDDADAAVATSHLDLDESKALVAEARRRNIKTVVTHVAFITASLSVEDQKWMADRGAYLELCYNSLTPAWKSTSIDDVVTAIRAVGTKHYILASDLKHYILASDLGQVHNPPPPEGIRRYIALLLKGGFEPDEIKMMVKDNPERLLGLD
jgi:hypothetical protein